MTKDFINIYRVVSNIPRGKVMTYKQVAQKSGVKNPRYAGYAIHQNTDIIKVPCHRVIRSDGKLASGYAHGGIKKQEKMLKKEEIKFHKDKIDFEEFLYNYK